MATTTRSITRALKKDSRMFDYIYDDNYTDSSQRDHDRMTRKAQTMATNIEPVPVFENLFSELPHFPRCQLKANFPFPAHLTRVREWRSSACQNRQSWIRYQTLNCDLPASLPTQHDCDGEKLETEGWDWYLNNTFRPLAPAREARTVSRHSLHVDVSIEDDGLKTVETQTDYRDSEAQTDPFSPLYVTPFGEAPELISLATLSWGKGLPAGLQEVQMIGRLRRKRAWEASLQGAKNSAQLEEKRRVITLIEAKEWLIREKQIERLQDARIEVMKKMQSQREALHEKEVIHKLDKIWTLKQKEKETTVKKIRNGHMKALRRLKDQRSSASAESKDRNIVKDYADPGSHVYAPVTRLGSCVDRNSQLYVVTSRHLSTYEGLLELEDSLPDFVLNPRVVKPSHPRGLQRSMLVPRLCRSNRDIAEALGSVDILIEKEGTVDTTDTLSSRLSQFVRRSMMLRQFADTSEVQSSTPQPGKVTSRRSTLRQMQMNFQINHTIARPTTPETSMLQDHPNKIIAAERAENVAFAVTLIQQLIRGRGVQNSMFEGKAKYRDLINEVKANVVFDSSTHQTLKHHMKRVTLTLQSKRAGNDHKASTICQALGEMEGRSLGRSLDFLSKELVRLQEERRVHAFAILCERHRRHRESVESRRRQQEQRRRAEEDEILKEIVKTHQGTIDAYLEQIISTTVDQMSDVQSRFEIQSRAEVINQLAHETEQCRDVIMSEEIVADLVHSFLIPEANKAFIRDKVRGSQRRFLLAAHKEIYREESPFLSNRPSAYTPSLPYVPEELCPGVVDHCL